MECLKQRKTPFLGITKTRMATASIEFFSRFKIDDDEKCVVRHHKQRNVMAWLIDVSDLSHLASTTPSCYIHHLERAPFCAQLTRQVTRTSTIRTPSIPQTTRQQYGIKAVGKMGKTGKANNNPYSLLSHTSMKVGL
jgi:hypothetical protein